MLTSSYQPTHNIQLDKLGTIEDIKLPLLEIRNIEKLDELFVFLKENYSSYNDVYRFCKERWGDNKLLYLCFAEYLKVNSFTLVQNDSNGINYSWKQRISERGLALDSFKKEYNRQYNKKSEPTKSRQRLQAITGLIHNLFF
ncbi:MAG TPA: hypothetical protein PKO16_00645 [Bacteroidia bacterium]|jgi:hypothetical protein|nr:hypothetical protein [Bacteroidia bacterium]